MPFFHSNLPPVFRVATFGVLGNKPFDLLLLRSCLVGGCTFKAFNVNVIGGFRCFTLVHCSLTERPLLQRHSALSATDFSGVDLLEDLIPREVLPGDFFHPDPKVVEELLKPLEDSSNPRRISVFIHSPFPFLISINNGLFHLTFFMKALVALLNPMKPLPIVLP